MKVQTLRFGVLEVGDGEIITLPEGIFGFPDSKRFCLVDSGDDTLILWLQSLDNPSIAFPVLEPKIFKPDYIVSLSAQELRHLNLENVNQSIVFTVLTIPKDVTQLTANLKAPLVINLSAQVGKQVVLQENEYALKYPIFKELKAHLMTIEASNATQARAEAERETVRKPPVTVPINLRQMAPSQQVRILS